MDPPWIDGPWWWDDVYDNGTDYKLLESCVKDRTTMQDPISIKIPTGWGDEQVDHKCSTGSWCEPHVRVTWWNRSHPEVFTPDGRAIGWRWVAGDGNSIREARANAASNIRAGKFYLEGNLLRYKPQGAAHAE